MPQKVLVSHNLMRSIESLCLGDGVYKRDILKQFREEYPKEEICLAIRQLKPEMIVTIPERRKPEWGGDGTFYIHKSSVTTMPKEDNSAEIGALSLLILEDAKQGVYKIDILKKYKKRHGKHIVEAAIRIAKKNGMQKVPEKDNKIYGNNGAFFQTKEKRRARAAVT